MGVLLVRLALIALVKLVKNYLQNSCALSSLRLVMNYQFEFKKKQSSGEIQ